ncbi:glycosyltransferase [Lacrimispora sp. NSJ-141]|uniref:Glycosyltransferase n=1 Tax=Lientehia hominis TaxID=2897778 RepID=A0AAP2W786_9FIRM|nr:glycosyltransferase [Lientehia hominis]MCD2492148.1 glycosyltransferase [Lientehia hominis]
MMPLVSVCIPAYNSAVYIKKTIESILDQNYKNIELVVVDDCSKDNTVEIVKNIEDSRMRLVQNEKNLGMTGNWNKCLAEAKGDYIKLVCADDILYADSIQKELGALLKHPDVTLVMSDTALIDENGGRTGCFKRYPKAGLLEGRKVAKRALIFKSFFGAPCNTLFPRSSYERAGGFDPKFPYILDFDMWLRMACLGKIYVIHEELNGFRVRNDSNTGNLINGDRKTYNLEHKNLLKKHNALGAVHLNRFELWVSMMIRHARNELIQIYLKVNAKKKR